MKIEKKRKINEVHHFQLWQLSVIRFDIRDTFRVYHLGWIVLLEALKKLCNLFTRFSKEFVT